MGTRRLHTCDVFDAVLRNSMGWRRVWQDGGILDSVDLFWNGVRNHYGSGVGHGTINSENESNYRIREVEAG